MLHSPSEKEVRQQHEMATWRRPELDSSLTQNDGIIMPGVGTGYTREAFLADHAIVFFVFGLGVAMFVFDPKKVVLGLVVPHLARLSVLFCSVRDSRNAWLAVPSVGTMEMMGLPRCFGLWRSTSPFSEARII